MLTILDKSAVRSFFKISKELIKKKKCRLEPRNYLTDDEYVNYKQAIIDLGIINKNDIWNYISELSEEDCFDVSMDRDIKRDLNSEMFEFNKIINDKKVYIKLTICNDDLLVCLSFHKSNSLKRRS